NRFAPAQHPMDFSGLGRGKFHRKREKAEERVAIVKRQAVEEVRAAWFRKVAERGALEVSEMAVDVRLAAKRRGKWRFGEHRRSEQAEHYNEVAKRLHESPFS